MHERAYWTGALVREANTRDLWSFITPDEIRAQWPHLQRHLGRARGMWAYLLDIKFERSLLAPARSGR